MPKIVTVQFDYVGTDKYGRLADVFLYSAKKHMPNTKLEMYRTNAPQTKISKNNSFITNTAKLDIWVQAMQKDKEDIIFMDCDMLLLGDISIAFKHEFDIAYTTRSIIDPRHRNVSINGGVMFVRNNEKTLAFMKRFKEINDQMFTNPKFHFEWRKRYAGMNQSAFGYMLNTPSEHNCVMLDLPCAIYNCCNTEWHTFDSKAKCLHIKSKLRGVCLGNNRDYSRDLDKPYKAWKQYETEWLKSKEK